MIDRDKNLNLHGLLAISLSLLFCFPGMAPRADAAQDLIDKVAVSETVMRYYIHLDRNGVAPPFLDGEGLKDQIVAGDQIVVRFYPNILFAPDRFLPAKSPKSIRTKMLFPAARSDTATVSPGFGNAYFLTRDRGAFLLRIAEKKSSFSVGDTVSYKDIEKEVTAKDSRELQHFAPILKEKGFGKEWHIRVFEAISYEAGNQCLELFQKGGSSAILIQRIDAVLVTEEFAGVKLVDSRDLSSPLKIAMEGRDESGFYQGLIDSRDTAVGIHTLNIIFDYTEASWNYRQAPTAARNKRLLYDGTRVIISKEPELPGNVRARAGFAVFDEATEARLISSFVLILDPKEYFSPSTSLFKRINPSLGVQIGGTGTQDLVFLMGLSLKLIDQGDLIVGLRFGREEVGTSWEFGNNFYFGMSLDPQLFNRLKNTKQ